MLFIYLKLYKNNQENSDDVKMMVMRSKYKSFRRVYEILITTRRVTSILFILSCSDVHQ